MDFKNTTDVWNDIWKDIPSEKQDKFHLEIEKKSVRWKRIKEKVHSHFGKVKGLKILEIGAGQGTYSLLFALEGAEVTLLDYSPKAISISKLFFKRNKAPANFILMDALKIDKKFLSKFDISISIGVAEHFSGENRTRIIKSHFDVLKENGLTFIDVPNKWCIPYRIHKFLSQKFGRWQFGEEIPYSRSEFIKIGEKIGKKFDFIGGYILDTSFIFKTRLKKIFGIMEDYNLRKVRKQFGTPFDEYISRTLIAVGKK